MSRNSADQDNKKGRVDMFEDLFLGLRTSVRANVEEHSAGKVDMFTDKFLGLRTSVEDQYGGERGTARHDAASEDIQNEKKADNDSDENRERAKDSEETSKIIYVPEYKWSGRKPKGLAVVIGIDEFDDEKLTNLSAMKVDKEMVMDMFNKIDFMIAPLNSNKKEDITNLLVEIARNHCEKYDCFAFYVSSHGTEGYVCCQDASSSGGLDGYLEIAYIIELFFDSSCQRFKGKPKLFFFDMCLGSSKQERTDHSVPKVAAQFKNEAERTAAYKHIFIGYATLNGYVSWTGKSGSRFTETLVNTINESTDRHSIEEIVSVVYDDMDKAKDGQQYKQTPTFASKLTKQLYLKE